MSIELEDGTLRIQQIIASADAEIKSTQVNKDIALEIDPGNLAVVDINFLDESSLRNKQTVDDVLLSAGRDSVQLLMRDVYNLPRKIVDNIPFAVMPEPSILLPREKPIPKDKVMTKWEKYAKEKGIVKKKKERKVWDETAQDFLPRYGKLKVQIDKEKNWVMEVPRQADIYEDQFVKAAKAKKERVAKNEFQRLRNIARDGKTATPGVGVMRTDTRDVTQLKKAMHFSRFATASLGKFQPILKNERDIKGFKKNARTESDKPLDLNIDQEKKKSLSIIDKIWNPKVNTDSAIIKQMERDIDDDEVRKRNNAKSDRRSKKGGRKHKVSGAKLASLTDGKMGDKVSKRQYESKKSEEQTKGGRVTKKKGNKKSAFGGMKGRKNMASISGGKMKRRR